MQEYVYLIRAYREQFIETMTDEESKSMADHFEYLKKLQAKDQLILAGPCLDGVFGIVIYRASSVEEAEAIMSNDPAVIAGIMQAEFHPYKVSLMEGR